jgi:bifunctional DNA-binding transcriptional regulator/antitoxin component of YhaV-PrlF toxin-antitoxin module
MLSFNRTLQKHVTKTGTYYVLSIPREIAQDLQLEAGGLCSFEVRTDGKAYVALTPYQDNPLDTSRAVYKQQFKQFKVASKLAVKHLEAQLKIMRSTELGRKVLAIAFRRRDF